MTSWGAKRILQSYNWLLLLGRKFKYFGSFRKAISNSTNGRTLMDLAVGQGLLKVRLAYPM